MSWITAFHSYASNETNYRVRVPCNGGKGTVYYAEENQKMNVAEAFVGMREAVARPRQQ